MSRLRCAVAALLAALALPGAGCGGGGGVSVTAADLGIATTASARPALATATLYTSPDGGIYRNPDHVDIVLAGTLDGDTLAARLGGAAADWSQLRALGPFTAIAVRLRDDGKVGSDPAMNDLQIASDFAPPGTGSGPLRHFYHPTRPMALISDRPVQDQCAVHLDPGQAATVVIVYPPVRRTAPLLWGRYQDFAVDIPLGGAADGLDGGLYAAACSPPEAPPA
jgi:hypothetical protein